MLCNTFPNFKAIPETWEPKSIEKGWGKELVIINTYKYCMKILFFKKGSTGSLHFHKLKDECWYVWDGQFKLIYTDPETGERLSESISEGQIVHLKPCATHQVVALTDVVIFEGSTEDQISDSFRIAPGDSQAK